MKHLKVSSITSHPESIFQTLKVIRISVNFGEMIWMYFQSPTLDTLSKSWYFPHGTIWSTFDLLQQSTPHFMHVLWEATVWSDLASVAILQFRPTFFLDSQFREYTFINDRCWCWNSLPCPWLQHKRILIFSTHNYSLSDVDKTGFVRRKWHLLLTPGFGLRHITTDAKPSVWSDAKNQKEFFLEFSVHATKLLEM